MKLFDFAKLTTIRAGESVKLLDSENRELTDWNQVYITTTGLRTPPILPEDFETRHVKQKYFTNGKTDAEFVAVKYKETFNHVIGHARTLWSPDSAG